MAGDPQMYVKVAANIEQLKASMAEARDEIKRTSEHGASSLDAFSSRMEHLGERVAEYFAVREIAHFVEEVLSGAHALEILSLQTDIGIQELQVLGAATQEYGLDTERLGTLIFQLSRRIAGGDESAATALHMMGLRVQDLRALDPESMFLTIARGLGSLEGSAADLAATDLFGGRAGKSILAFSKDVDGAMAAVRGSIAISSEESVRQLAAMDVQITRAKTSLTNWATEVVGQVAQGFNVLRDANTQGASKWEIFVAMVKDWAGSSVVAGASTSNLTKLLTDHNVVAHESALVTKAAAEEHKKATEVIDARAAATKFMTALLLDNAKPIAEWQREDLDQLGRLGELNTKNAAAIGVSAAQLKVYQDNLQTTVKVQAEATKLWAEFDDLVVQHNGTATDKQIADIDKWYAEVVAKLQAANAYNDETASAVEAVWHEKLAGVATDHARVAKGSIEALQQELDKQIATLDEMTRGRLHYSRTAIDAQRAVVDAGKAALRDEAEATDQMIDAFAKWNDEIMQVNRSLDGTIQDAQKLKELRDMGNTLDVGTAAQDPEIMNLLHSGWSLKNAEAIKLGRLYGFTPKLYDPKGNPETTPSSGERVPGYASGTDFHPGGLAVVGELGPELVNLPRGSSVTPSGGAGSVVVNIHVTQPLGTPQQIGRVVLDAVIPHLKAQGFRFTAAG